MGVARVLNRYDVSFYECPSCGFIQTESPYWLEEAYAKPFMKNDIGLIKRNNDLSRVTALVLSLLFDPNSQFLDYGGGNGMFVRIMRDKGYDFYWHDKYAENQFAAGFEIGERRRFGLMTAFELFEHLPSPLETIHEMLRYSDAILFSTLLVPRPRPSFGEWWYYALDGGQHVSFFTARSLRILAKRLGLGLCSNGSSLHLFARKKFPNWAFALLSNDKIARLGNALIRRKSLLADDYYRLTGQRLS